MGGRNDGSTSRQRICRGPGWGGDDVPVGHVAGEELTVDADTKMHGSAHCLLLNHYLIERRGQVLSIGAGDGQVPVGSLPQPPGTDPNYYHGQPPRYSMNVQYDGYGRLLFFVIDGAIYDHEGFLIADNRLTANCQECLFRRW